jgi:hypothetical protein
MLDQLTGLHRRRAGLLIWGGIDEAGYGPRLGPLVVAGTAFAPSERPRRPGYLWNALRDAVTRDVKGSDGRLVVNDSKKVYSPSQGLRRLEEGVLAFLHVLTGRTIATTGDLLAVLRGKESDTADGCPWFARAEELKLPLESNPSAVKSKAAVLRQAMDAAGVRPVAALAAVVRAPEYNRIVSRTHNKSLLLFQKCGLLLASFWQEADQAGGHILIDRHGGRKRYRALLLDAFPGCACDVLGEEDGHSTYRVSDTDRSLVISFREGGDTLALPTALGSMIAKYVRELHMHVFNRYWRERLDGLKPTAGYGKDARRFLGDIDPVIEREGIDRRLLIRGS